MYDTQSLTIMVSTYAILTIVCLLRLIHDSYGSDSWCIIKCVTENIENTTKYVDCRAHMGHGGYCYTQKHPNGTVERGCSRRIVGHTQYRDHCDRNVTYSDPVTHRRYPFVPCNDDILNKHEVCCCYTNLCNANADENELIVESLNETIGPITIEQAKTEPKRCWTSNWLPKKTVTNDELATTSSTSVRIFQSSRFGLMLPFVVIVVGYTLLYYVK